MQLVPEQVPKLLELADSAGKDMRIPLLRAAVAADPLDTLGHHNGIISKHEKMNVLLASCVREKHMRSMGDSMDNCWHPFGNTPAVNLFKDHRTEEGASVLSVASGDLRHILYTCSQLKGQNGKPSHIEFCVNDIDAHVTARNLLFVLLLNGSTFEYTVPDSIELVIALWYSARISQQHADMLMAAIDTLLEMMVVGTHFLCGNVKLDAESAA